MPLESFTIIEIRKSMEQKESILHFLMILSIKTGPTFLHLWQCNRQWEREAFHIARYYYLSFFLVLNKREGNGTE